jgi:hypothetical protein
MRVVMKDHPKQPEDCPLAPVDKRLSDAHQLWHQAEEAYFDPDRFRIAAQGFIQTLRTVTFILQKNKEVIPDFATWYGTQDKKSGEWKFGKWMECLAGDPLMCWMKDARNRIEKQGDLEAHSFVRAEIIASHLDEGPKIELPAELFQSPAALLRSIPAGAVGEHVKQHGFLRIERRWVENSLPEYELLSALATAYGKIAELVFDAHKQVGLSPEETIHGEHGKTYDLPAMGWRFPCMIAHEMPRALLISLKDGARLELQEKTITQTYTPEEAAAALAKFPLDAAQIMGRKYSNYHELAQGYFELIRSVFLKDGHHETILFLFRDTKPLRQIGLEFEDHGQKYLIMRALAGEITKTGADAAMIVGESWSAPAERLRPYERPENSPYRVEFLTADLVSSTGEPISFRAHIARDGEKVSLGQTNADIGVAAFKFAHFYAAWGRPVPKAWIDAADEIMAKAKK